MAMFLCMRSQMGLCKHTDCDHHASHDLTVAQNKISPCCTIHLCEKMNIKTRCDEVNA